ncbi:hypothetical protein H4R33_002907 [Dimargaris cristalligena]|uniref:Uncharacterized protein n=1 Tax=Dimargaris cristalligena TaxID=215637 RepID=A0A4V1J4A5_9FUNG|nr:hypothetical protein H4R33_002907 [Dimargaris cristalligena]RKP34879.1 hypothetical protein BJ085DRAFT_35867 [Dimargaris cristalligena]|eukprot:RKP34879.1 hypothetical protein BJ085DRAFT_35867 [Dimargaris cristalligena]
MKTSTSSALLVFFAFTTLERATETTNEMLRDLIDQLLPNKLRVAIGDRLSIAFKAVETFDQRILENSAQQILQFTVEFYSLACLESWAQIMGSFLSEFQDIPLNQDTLDESIVDVPYANDDTLVYLKRIYRSTSTHFSLLHEPQFTLDIHFGTTLQLSPKVEMLNELLVMVEIFNGADQQAGYTLESQKQLFIECLTARDLANAA